MQASADAHFCTLLREWRRARGLSQLELALEADVSARHLSFLESGRAQPSRAMTMQLAQALLLPRAATNALLASAGFAPAFPATPLSAESLAPFRAMLEEMMRRHARRTLRWCVTGIGPSSTLTTAPAPCWGGCTTGRAR